MVYSHHPAIPTLIFLLDSKGNFTQLFCPFQIGSQIYRMQILPQACKFLQLAFRAAADEPINVLHAKRL